MFRIEWLSGWRWFGNWSRGWPGMKHLWWWWWLDFRKTYIKLIRALNLWCLTNWNHGMVLFLKSHEEIKPNTLHKLIEELN
jgi:hypothetical protein